MDRPNRVTFRRRRICREISQFRGVNRGLAAGALNLLGFIPHGAEETRKTLFCSDLFHHFGNVAAVTSSDLIEPARKAMQQMQQGPLADYMPYTSQTEGVLRGLAALEPETLAVMHGSSYIGKSGRLLTDLAGVIKDEFEKV